MRYKRSNNSEAKEAWLTLFFSFGLVLLLGWGLTRFSSPVNIDYHLIDTPIYYGSGSIINTGILGLLVLVAIISFVTFIIIVIEKKYK